jgi:cell division protein FtsL
MQPMKALNFEASSLYRNGILALLLICVALIVHNVFSQNGFLASRRQRKELQALEQKIQRMKTENEQLDLENRALKSNPAAIERLAREQYGLAKPGERIYSVPGGTPATNPPAPSSK